MFYFNVLTLHTCTPKTYKVSSSLSMILTFFLPHTHNHLNLLFIDAMPFVSESTTSLLPHTSTTPYAPPPPPQQKDYASAFASLQSTYGTAGHIPTPVSASKKSTRQPTHTSSRPSTPPRNLPTPNAPRDFQAAFGKLSSSYGFAGLVPSLPSRRVKS